MSKNTRRLGDWPKALDARVQHAMRLPIPMQHRTAAALGYIIEHIARETGKAVR